MSFGTSISFIFWLIKFSTEDLFKLSIQSSIKKIDKQIGDLPFTNSSNKKVFKDLKYKPKIDLDTGIENFVKWYKEYHK